MHQPKVRMRSRTMFEIIEQQQYRCALTGRTLEPDTAIPDHIVPISRGGAKADPNNIQIVHKDVNQAKGTMMLGDFIQLCREVVAWADGNCD